MHIDDRKTKIVATIGPATEANETLEAVIGAGVDVARQNFSHGTHEEHRDLLESIREKSDDVAVMMDTQGPDVRLRKLEEAITLEDGDTIHLVSDGTSNQDQLYIDHAPLLENIEVNDTVIIGDGDVALAVTETDPDVVCEVIYSGEITAEKSVNVPGKDVGPDGLMKKDKKDIAFGAEEGFDFVSVSFVKRREDIEAVQEILDEHDSNMDIIAKIEHIKAVENFDAILEASDGVMIARGDLGVEMSAAEVPLLQKKFIKKCNRAGKPVITATQMLSSMTDHPTATRAEVSDIANAVEDGTDAVMLSGETAVGEYPVRAVEVMADAVRRMEDYMEDKVWDTVRAPSTDTTDVISKNIWQAAKETNAKYILVHTSSGYTARHIAKHRPTAPIIAFTHDKTVKRQLNLVWGVSVFSTEFADYVEDMVEDSTQRLKDNGLVEDDDMLVLSAGVPTAVSGTTNTMEVRTVENILKR